MTVSESRLTCPGGCTNHGKDFADWPCSILPEPVQFKLDPKNFATDRELARDFGEGAIVRYPYSCSAHGLFGVERVRLAEPQEQPHERERKDWL